MTAAAGPRKLQMPGGPGFAPAALVRGRPSAGDLCWQPLSWSPQDSTQRAVSVTFLCSLPSPKCLLYLGACGSRTRSPTFFPWPPASLGRAVAWGSLCSWASAALGREVQQVSDDRQGTLCLCGRRPPPRLQGLTEPSGQEGAFTREGRLAAGTVGGM